MKIYIIILWLTTVLFSCNKGGRENNDPHAGQEMDTGSKMDTVNEIIYYCPMDTQIVQNKPGTCPICGMELESTPGDHSHHSMSEGDWVYRPVNVSILSTTKSIKPSLQSVAVKIKVAGYISYDERRMNTISAKTGGRIEDLYIKYNYQSVKKGQALFEIFSHDLQTAQEEYLYLKKNDPYATDLLISAKNKLLLLGMTQGQINRISAGDHIHVTTTVYSPYTGFVIEEKEDKETFSSNRSMDNNSEMNESSKMNENKKEVSIREGAYVNKGEAVFKVVNTDVVWAIFEVYSNQLINIKINQLVHIKAEGIDAMIMGKINFIEPSYKDGTVRIRVYLNNKDQNLKIGNILSGEIDAGEKKGLWIPTTSVYDLGTEKIVFIKSDGAFETRKVTLGYSSEKEVEIINGLTEGEEIGENAQFMVDSESFIKVKK